MDTNIFQPLSATDLAYAEFATFLMFRHGLDANILNASGIIAVCEAAGFLMQKVTVLIGNFFMDSSYPQFLFIPITASLLPFGKFSLCLTQSLLDSPQEI